jgi:hypothetical protein
MLEKEFVINLFFEGPVVGQVYGLRVTLIDVYDIDVSGKSNISSKNGASTCSSTGSSRSDDYRKKPRPCLVWKLENEEITVLACSKFAGKGPQDSNILPEVPKARLNSTMVLIKGKEPTDVTQCFRSNNLNTFKNGTYMILIEHMVMQGEHDWSKTDGIRFNKNQMLHINELLVNLKQEEVRLKGEEDAARIEQLDLTQPEIINSDGNDERKEDNESETGSSIEIGLFHRDEYIDKTMFITRWLNDGKNKIIRKKILINISYSNGR